MGYRSDVRIIVTRKGFKKLRELVRDRAAARGDSYNLVDNVDRLLYADDQVMLCWNNIKWYQGCKGYECISDVMRALDGIRNYGHSFSYARIGENIDDIDENHYEGTRDDEEEVDWAYIRREFEDENQGFKEEEFLNV